MLRIYIARHGQNNDNARGILNGHRDEPLTSIGVAQAKELARSIRQTDLTFDKVYSSPLSRALRTAEIICEELEMQEPTILPELIERDFGVMTGQNISDIEKLCAPHILKTKVITYFITAENAETFPQLIERARKLLATLMTKHSSGSILLATHGDFGKMLYSAYYNLDWKDVLSMFHFGNSELLLLSPDVNPEDAHVFQQEQHNH